MSKSKSNVYTQTLTSIYLVLAICFSCADVTQSNAVEHTNNLNLKNQITSNLTADTSLLYEDTLKAYSEDDLIRYLKSNRLIKLLNHDYILKSSLNIESFKNLKIEGSSNTRIVVEGNNIPVLKISKSSYLHLDSLIIGPDDNPKYYEEHGILKVENSNYFTISNCSINGAGTFGFITKDVRHLDFINSEITNCTGLIFELENSRNCVFKHSSFHGNTLSTSVLGGFTENSRDIVFLNCIFENNKPEMIGNPVFNLNYNNESEIVLFQECTFKNNKGFKWQGYGEKIKLANCNVDSSDFIGFEKN